MVGLPVALPDLAQLMFLVCAPASIPEVAKKTPPMANARAVTGRKNDFDGLTAPKKKEIHKFYTVRRRQSKLSSKSL